MACIHGFDTPCIDSIQCYMLYSNEVNEKYVFYYERCQIGIDGSRDEGSRSWQLFSFHRHESLSARFK